MECACRVVGCRAKDAFGARSESRAGFAGRKTASRAGLKPCTTSVVVRTLRSAVAGRSAGAAAEYGISNRSNPSAV